MPVFNVHWSKEVMTSPKVRVKKTEQTMEIKIEDPITTRMTGRNKIHQSMEEIQMEINQMRAEVKGIRKDIKEIIQILRSLQ